MRDAPPPDRLAVAGLFLCFSAAGLSGCGAPGNGNATAPGGGGPGDSGAAAGAEMLSTAPRESSLQTGLQLYLKGDFEGAEPLLVDARRTNPRDRRILQALGAIYLRSDRTRQAEESLRLALEVEPGAIGARLGLAEVLRDGGRYPEALEALDEVLRRQPDNLTALLKRAQVLQRLGRLEEAQAAARAVIERQDGNAEAHYVLGLCLERQKDLEQAAGELRKTVERAPRHLGALSRLATVEKRLGRPEEAERFRAAHRAALARSRVEERVRGHRRRGVAAFNRQDYAAALEAFRAVEREDPSDPQVYLYLGSVQIAIGELDEARAALERSLDLEPRNARALMELGRLHGLAGRLDEAVEALRAAIAINPDFAEPHYFLAGVYRARGQIELYRSELQRFQELKTAAPAAAMEIDVETSTPDRPGADR